MYVNRDKQGRWEGRSAETGSLGHSLELTESWERGELRLQVHCLWPPRILPEGAAYNIAEQSDQGRDFWAKTKYRYMTAAV